MDFVLREIERKNLEKKAGKSIRELIERDVKVSEHLLKEDELDLELEKIMAKQRRRY